MLEKIEGRRRRLDDIINGAKFEQPLGDSEGQASLARSIHGVGKSQT